MKAQILFTCPINGQFSFTCEAISVGASLSTGAVTVHCQEDDSLDYTQLLGYGFQPINEVFPTILTRTLTMENEPTITGLVAK